MKGKIREGIGMTSSRTRERMVATLMESGIHEPRVLHAFRTVPRHLFVDEALSHRAYENTPLPIGFGQTISQPYIVALMTQAAMELEPRKILEIGTGSGYQAAILSTLAKKIYSVERIDPLERRTRNLFKTLEISNITQKHDDGHVGWLEYAPFDVIVVTAAAAAVPSALRDQLRDGGRMVVPVDDGPFQKLITLDKEGESWKTTHLENVVFVPMRSGLKT